MSSQPANEPQSQGEIPNSAFTEFAARVSRYFLDFLETDFKRQQAPRRKVQLKNDAGFRTGVPLRKYPTLYAAVWKSLSTPVDQLQPLRIPRNRHTAPISPILRDLIRQHVDGIDASSFVDVHRDVLDFARSRRGNATDNPEKFVEDVQSAFGEAVGKHVVSPVLALLDGPFREKSYSAIESVYEVEVDLTESLARQAVEQLPAPLNHYLVSGDLSRTERVLSEFFSEHEAKERSKSFFDDFATADAFQELRDLANYMRLGGENLQVYLYVCDLRFGTSAYPVFYIPANINIDETSGDMTVEYDPHLYVNKRAIDYVAQELAATAATLALSPIDNRIIYLGQQQSFIELAERVIAKLRPTFDLNGDFDVGKPALQALESTRLRLSKAAYFAVFDRSDESLLNDYEALLAAVGNDQDGIAGLFEGIIRGFLVNEPISVQDHVSGAWDEKLPGDRLVAESPIPLNEEQRKILEALDHPDCRFITVQGPPGTGKSHTITAIAFNCILNNKNVLVLSDKQEALDVVENKLKSALASARQDDDFPNPILRLGKSGNTFSRLISPSSQTKIRNFHQSTKAHAAKLLADTVAARKDIQTAIASTINAYTGVSLSEIEDLHRREEIIETRVNGLARLLQDIRDDSRLHLLDAAVNAPRNHRAADILAQGTIPKPLPYDSLLWYCRVYATAQRLLPLRSHRSALGLFEALSPNELPLLDGFIANFESLRMPIVGYLFAGSKLRALNAQVRQALPDTRALDLHRHVPELKIVHECLVTISRALAEEGLTAAEGKAVYHLVQGEMSYADMPPVRDILMAFRGALGNQAERVERDLEVGKNFSSVGELLDFVETAIRYALLWRKISHSLASAPPFDYVGSKSTLEQLHTTRMTHEIDRRFLDFVENNRATAKTLGGLIKAKQQFPQDKFAGLKAAFPCIIAGIREFAEYVPLSLGIFDVVVVDEASQVSVAQAFPALLRAKKVVVFGDQKQFSNVKSAQASNTLNQGYLSGLEHHFKARISVAADKVQRLKQFDVKRSVLEFFELITNYTDMLRKHFRGYQELISFSSEYFYDGELQAIKIRGKPIDEVIEFSVVAPSAVPERYRNVNTPEAEFIRDRLRQLVDDEEGLSVGIITPFREQQQYLTRLLFADPYASRFEHELRLKIMTFDTCQGEERDVIVYSMVATPTHDLLNYIFPVDLQTAKDRVEEMLKAQRLNVGFSRAKERIHFVLSKPVEQFHGSIGRALSHYEALLTEHRVPDAEETDAASPMEAKVLDWIEKTPFFQRNRGRLELLAQFPIGNYLRQLDATYQHPAYRCDFLLRFQGDDRTFSVIIEYDGFQEHFTDHQRVHAGNYDKYYRAEDIERQMVLESYGYKFLRINRFNLGSDPVQTLSARLETLIAVASLDEDAAVVTRIHQGAEGLSNGSSKHCRRCEQIKPLASFYDPKLRGGEGGHGQICLECKRGSRSTGGRVRSFGRSRRYWRRW